MSVASEIQRLQGAKADIKTAIEGKGVTVPSATKLDGYATLIGNISTTPSLQSKPATPSTSQQIITADNGYYGLSQVTVNAVTSSIDANITAGNIKSGVSILGVTGNYTGASATVATTTATVGSNNASSLAFTVSGNPKMFAVQLSLASSGSYLANSSTSTYYVSSVIGDGSNVYTTAYRYNSSGTRAAREYYYTTGSKSYNNGTFTVAAGTGSFAANQTYRLIYVY